MVTRDRRGKTSKGRDYDVASFRPSTKFLPAERVTSNKAGRVKKKQNVLSIIASKIWG